MKRFLSSALAVGLGLTLFAGPAAAQGNSGRNNNAPEGPMMLSEGRMDWLEGDAAWVNVSWTTEYTVTDVQLTVTSNDDGVVIGYPTNLETYTGLANGHELERYEVDYTGFYLDASAVDKKNFDLDLTLTWTENGVAQSKDFSLDLKQVSYVGDEFYEFVTETVVVPATGAPASGWIEFDFIGRHPNLSRMQLDVDTDLSVIYPQTTYSSLHYDARLRSNERDVIRVWIDPAQLTAGESHELTVNVGFRAGKGPKTRVHTVVLEAA